MKTDSRKELADTADFYLFGNWSWPMKALLVVGWTSVSFVLLSLMISVPLATNALTRQRAESKIVLAAALEEQKKELKELTAIHRGQLQTLETLRKGLISPTEQIPGVLEVNAKLEAKTVLSRRAAIGGQSFVDLPNDSYCILGAAVCSKTETTVAIAIDEMSGSWFFVLFDGRYPDLKKLTISHGVKINLGF